MGKIAARSTRVYLDHYDISGDINNTALKVDQETPNITTFADDGNRRLPGNYDHSNDHTAFMEFADDASEEQFNALIGSTDDHFLTQCFAGLTEGEPAYVAQATVSSQQRSGQNGGAQLIQISMVGDDALIRGIILRAGSVSAGNGTGRNLGATSAGTEFGVLFILKSFTGTSITMKLQESSDDAAGDAYADITGLTSGALTAAGKVYVETTSATEAWKRVVCSGTFSAAVVLVVAGRVLGT